MNTISVASAIFSFILCFLRKSLACPNDVLVMPAITTPCNYKASPRPAKSLKASRSFLASMFCPTSFIVSAKLHNCISHSIKSVIPSALTTTVQCRNLVIYSGEPACIALNTSKLAVVVCFTAVSLVCQVYLSPRFRVQLLSEHVVFFPTEPAKCNNIQATSSTTLTKNIQCCDLILCNKAPIFTTFKPGKLIAVICFASTGSKVCQAYLSSFPKLRIITSAPLHFSRIEIKGCGEKDGPEEQTSTFEFNSDLPISEPFEDQEDECSSPHLAQLEVAPRAVACKEESIFETPQWKGIGSCIKAPLFRRLFMRVQQSSEFTRKLGLLA